MRKENEVKRIIYTPGVSNILSRMDMNGSDREFRNMFLGSLQILLT